MMSMVLSEVASPRGFGHHCDLILVLIDDNSSRLELQVVYMAQWQISSMVSSQQACVKHHLSSYVATSAVMHVRKVLELLGAQISVPLCSLVAEVVLRYQP